MSREVYGTQVFTKIDMWEVRVFESRKKGLERRKNVKKKNQRCYNSLTRDVLSFQFNEKMKFEGHRGPK